MFWDKGLDNAPKICQLCAKTFEYYNPDFEKGINYLDPVFNIPFPLKVTTISKKDSSWKPFKL